ncbi:MAG: GspH/FimT family pseudopilin [Herminiimonas sp.]|nr:GspH/FimT family pseudopilin [Herminiimonas sp.]
MLLTTRPPVTYGFTLVELVITMAVAAILMTVSTVSFASWIANAKVRSVAEVLQNALRLAQMEALKRSRQTVFVLTSGPPELNATPSASGTNWYIQVLPIVGTEAVQEAYVQGGNLLAQSSGVTVSAAAAQICFNSAGRVVANPAIGNGASCTVPAAGQLYTVSKTGADRVFKIQLSNTGKIRMCDAAKTLSLANPDGC